jgi:hypothetical protein
MPGSDIISDMNIVLRPILLALGLISIIAASFAVGMIVGDSASASGNYDVYLAVAIAVAVIAVLAAVIVYLLRSRRRQS